MDLLIVGIDGGDERIFKGVGTEYINSIIDENTSIEVQEDLWNRGWVSILSGKHCRSTGACYEKPKLDGTYDFTQKFSMEDYDNIDSTTPLWELLNNNGYDIGFMNVPSTLPAPEVNGFIVSGGGAGAPTSGSAEIPDSAYYPDEVIDELREAEYILDTRFRASGIRDFSSFTSRLKNMQIKRTESYKRLVDKYQPDVGFIAYMATKGMQYLAMSEIEDMLSTGTPSNKKQKQINDLYSNFDNCIKDLISGINPERVIFVADHSASAYKYHISPDALLREVGLQTKRAESIGTIKSIVQKSGRKLPESIKTILKSHSESVVSTVKDRNINWEKTKAFGARYVPGVYINDEHRFGGPVSESNIAIYVNQIIEEINNHPEANEYNVTAQPYRRNHSGVKYQNILPDVWIDTPDVMFFEEKDKFIKPNTDYGQIESLKMADRDQYTGIKGSKPLLAVDDELAADVKEEGEDTPDLTLTYEIIRRFIER